MIGSIKIAPSILAADFGRLEAAVREAEAAGADLIHIDVMDGHFVPNITIGPVVVAALRTVTDLPLDVHLMISEPSRFVDVFVEAGADILTVHLEASINLYQILQHIRSLGIKAGISLNPTTPESALRYVLPFVDMVLVMTVNPGFGGQSFIPEMLPKINLIRQMLDAIDSSAYLSVDGGIDSRTAPLVVAQGADVLVAGSAIFRSALGVKNAITALRAADNKKRPR